LSGFGEGWQAVYENELKIRKEYAWVDWTDYVAGKLEFLAQYIQTPIAQKFSKIHQGMTDMSAYIVNESAPSIGVYAGSFNPFHVGHQNILRKAEKIFDKVVVAVGRNPYKDKEDKRTQWKSPDALKYHQVDFYDTSIVEYFNTKKYNPTLIRGLRNTTDLQAELVQLRWLQELKPDIKVVNIVCDLQFEHVSSSAIRAVRNAGFTDLADVANQFTVK
jgi:pantetheine-phosphate adenylyltransferase